MIWGFIQNQMLGMKWLNELIGKILTVVGLDVNSRLGGSIQFFIYDVLKITVLLCFLIYVISYIQSYFPPERSKKIMGRFKGVSANCIAAFAWNGNTVLFLFIYSLVYRIYKRRATVRSNLFLFDFISDG